MEDRKPAPMLDWLSQLQRRTRLPLLLLLASVSLQLYFHAVADADGKASGSEIPRGPAPHTMSHHEASLPLLQTKTLFVVDNEPILESHIVSNLLHQLLFTLRIPQQHIRMRDEAFLLGGREVRQNAASLGRWLATEAEKIPQDIEFVFVCTAYTRIDPQALEALLTELKKGVKDGTMGPIILGWGLADEKSTIIHHFKEAKSHVYPHLDAGSVWSRAAFASLQRAFKENPPAPSIERDFGFELFLYLKNEQQLQLLHSELFCPQPPAIENYERATTVYPARHTRPQSPLGGEASAAASKRKLTEVEAAAAAAAASIAAIHKGCAAFASGSKHAPVLSHQMFDALIDFDEDLLVSPVRIR